MTPPIDAPTSAPMLPQPPASIAAHGSRLLLVVKTPTTTPASAPTIRPRRAPFRHSASQHAQTGHIFLPELTRRATIVQRDYRPHHIAQVTGDVTSVEVRDANQTPRFQIDDPRPTVVRGRSRPGDSSCTPRGAQQGKERQSRDTNAFCPTESPASHRSIRRLCFATAAVDLPYLNTARHLDRSSG